jgi:hypothetical protein
VEPSLMFFFHWFSHHFPSCSDSFPLYIYINIYQTVYTYIWIYIYMYIHKEPALWWWLDAEAPLSPLWSRPGPSVFHLQGTLWSIPGDPPKTIQIYQC